MARNPFLGNPIVAGLGALSQGIQLGEQQKAQEAAQQAAMQRQAMLDAAKATLDKSQAGNYDASAYESRARADNLGTVAAETHRQNLMKALSEVEADLPKQAELSVTRGDPSAYTSAVQYRNWLRSQLQGDAPADIPSPTGGSGGNLGAPSFAGPSAAGGYTGGFSGAPAGIPSPTGGSAGDLGVPSVPAGVPLPPFAQQLQDASKPPPFDINSQFGIPKPVAAPAYVPPKPVVTTQGGPQQVTPGVPDIPQAPQQGGGVGLTNSPLELSQLAQANESNARARETNQKALQLSMANGDPMPVIGQIGMRPHQEQTLRAQEANANYERNGIPIHIPVPGVDFNGFYSPDVKTAADVAKLVADTHKTNVDAMLAPYKARAEIAHMQNQDQTAAAAQRATETHYGAQDTIAGEKFNYQKDQGFKNNPDTQKKIASYTSQITSLQTAIDNANKAQIAAVANTTITPQARQIILKTQDDIKRDALTKQQALKDKIDSLGQSQQGASNYGNLPTNPLAPSYIDKAIQDCKATGAGSGGHCDRLARISTEKTDPVNAQYFDRKPGATALTTLANFQRAGKAFPLKPGMSLPPGTLVFSTKLGKGAGPRGTDAGHVAMIGSDGQPNDQHAKNQIALGKFDYFVPPSGSAPRNAPRETQNTASSKGRSIKVGGKTFTVEM